MNCSFWFLSILSIFYLFCRCRICQAFLSNNYVWVSTKKEKIIPSCKPHGPQLNMSGTCRHLFFAIFWRFQTQNFATWNVLKECGASPAGWQIIKHAMGFNWNYVVSTFFGQFKYLLTVWLWICGFVYVCACVFVYLSFLCVCVLVFLCIFVYVFCMCILVYLCACVLVHFRICVVCICVVVWLCILCSCSIFIPPSPCRCPSQMWWLPISFFNDLHFCNWGWISFNKLLTSFNKLPLPLRIAKCHRYFWKKDPCKRLARKGP